MTELNKYTIPVQNVQVGDEIENHRLGNTREVASVKTGTKWVTARDADGKLVFEKQIGELVEVGRWELTQEEKDERNAEAEANRREELGNRIELWAATRVDELESKLLQCVARIMEGYSDQHSRMMHLQAEAQIADEIKQMVELGNKPDRNEKFWGELAPAGSFTWADAYDVWKREATKKITGQYSFRADRRDAFEDVKLEVTLKVLHQGDYGYWSF